MNSNRESDTIRVLTKHLLHFKSYKEKMLNISMKYNPELLKQLFSRNTFPDTS